MDAAGGSKRWWTAAELAGAKLPGLSTAKRKINELAEDERWALKVGRDGQPLARKRQGRGGGVEYHVDVLPVAARMELVRRGLLAAEPLTATAAAVPAAAAPVGVAAPANDDGRSEAERLWAWYAGQSAATKAEAERRLAAVQAVANFERAGLNRSASVPAVAGQLQVACSTVWNWLGTVAGADPALWLPLLAPRHRGGGAEAEIDPRVWQHFSSLYLTPERRTYALCWRLTKEAVADPLALPMPSAKTLQRRLEKTVPAQVVTLKRQGADALRRMLPPSERSIADLHALEVVNIDGHTWDNRVAMPDGQIVRRCMIAVQDIYSRKVLAFRMGVSESAVLTRLAFADLFRGYGIPRVVVMDNGRAFASKWITGGQATRFRFKVREEEPLGLLTAVGCTVVPTLPYRGQSKPIERAFRDLCNDVAKDPRLHGAWTGNTALSKPDNYGERAIPVAEFDRIVAERIAAHNARIGRRTEACGGRYSFDEAFAASYAAAPIRKATPDQLKLALLAAEQLRADRETGAVRLMGNRYWSDELARIAGEPVTVRFDPDNLHSEIHVYDRQGRFLATAPVWEATGFLDAAAAKARAKLEGDWKKAARRAAELQGLLTAEELAAAADATPFASPDLPEPSVIRPVRVRGSAAPAAAAVPAGTASPSFMEAFVKGVAHLRVVE